MSGKIANAQGKKIGVVLSGGNVDPKKLTEILVQ